MNLSAQVLALANQIAAFTTREASSSKETAMVATTSYTSEGLSKSSVNMLTTGISTTAPKTCQPITIRASEIMRIFPMSI